jgi:hypothetical protein
VRRKMNKESTANRMARAADLRCPFCGLVIGDIEDGTISDYSIKHDIDACEIEEVKNHESIS